MKLRPCLLALLCQLAASPAVAEMIEGVVKNGTFGRLQAGAAVELLKLDQGMEPVRDTRSDAQGRYRLDDVSPPGPGAPYLLRVTYAEVNYHQPVIFQGASTARVDVEVFERTVSEKGIVIDVHGLSLEPAEGRLVVREAFTVQNRTSPPRTIYRQGGTFRFSLPGGARDVQLSVQGLTGMPLEQTPVETAPGQHAVDFPLRPGTTQVRLGYQMDYAAAQAMLALKIFYPINHTQVFTPAKGVELSSETLELLGTEPSSQLSAYGVEKLPAGAVLQFSVRGNPPASAQQASAGQNTGGVGSITIFPNAVGQARWYILAFAFFVLALGLYYLYTAEPPAPNKPGQQKSSGKQRRSPRATEPINGQTLARD